MDCTSMEELDNLYLIIKDRGFYYTRVELINALVGYTNKLHTLLLSLNIPNTYIPSEYLDQSIYVYPECKITVGPHIHSRYKITIGPHGTYCSWCRGWFGGVVDLVDEIQTEATSRAITHRCSSCHYSDNDVEFCGLGLVLTYRCTHYIPVTSSLIETARYNVQYNH
jgi:hypothetical protein